jgi:hypothetical protein
MTQYLAIVVYRCLVAGSPEGSLDIQVRWYDARDETSVRTTIAAEPILSYKNSDGETVSWELAEVMAVEPFAPKDSGEEVIGFIASVRELTELA